MYLVKTPAFIKKIYPDLIWDLNRNEKTAYLTFDDGPVPESTPWVLDVLKEYKLKATFFCIGQNVIKNPDIYQRLLDEGHRVGNHTQTHVAGWTTKNGDYLKEIETAAQSISSHLFRPPYGRITRSQAKALKKDYKIIMWDVISGDFDQSITAEACYKNVVNNVRNGSIIVFHDSAKAKERLHGSLERVLDNLLEEEYKFKLIPNTF